MKKGKFKNYLVENEEIYLSTNQWEVFLIFRSQNLHFHENLKSHYHCQNLKKYRLVKTKLFIYQFTTLIFKLRILTRKNKFQDIYIKVYYKEINQRNQKRARNDLD